jgi:hypothetical protein
VLNGKTVTEAVAPNRWSWMMTTGRALPLWAPRAAAGVEAVLVALGDASALSRSPTPVEKPPPGAGSA